MVDLDLLALLLCAALAALLAIALVVAVWGTMSWLCQGLAGTWRAFWAEPPAE